MILAPGITVNGIKITSDQINFEVQHHPAESLVRAKYEAMQVLVIRELLIQRAVDLGLCDHDEAVKNPDNILEVLFEQEIQIPEAYEETCHHFYKNNKNRFYTSPLFEVSHILYSALPSDEATCIEALGKAQNALSRIQAKPESFEMIARTESACSSAETGGHLGQITKGQTTPAFEAALMDMQEGEISKDPLVSEFGYHIIKVHKRLEGKKLPFEAVQDWVADHLRCQSWQLAFNQYVQILAGQAEISGFQLKSTNTPLVQ